MNQGSAKRRRLQYDDESYIAGPSSQSQPYFPASGQHLQSSYIIPSHVDLTHVSQRVLESGSQTIQQLQNPQPFGSGFFGFDNRSVPGVSDVMLQTTQQPQLFAGDIFDFSVPTASGIPKTTMASFSDFQLAPSDRYIQQPPILPQPWIRTQYQKDAPILPPLHVNLVPSIKPIQMLQLQLPALKINPKIICFGRITTILGRWEYNSLSRPPFGRFPVELLSSSEFALPEQDSHASGKIDTIYTQIVNALREEEALELHAACTILDETANAAASSAWKTLPCQLEIVLYGPDNLLDELVPWLEESEIYLQDPVECHPGRDVVYRNPQRLSTALDPEACCTVSVFLQQQQSLSALQKMVPVNELPPQDDLLEILSNHIDLEEAKQPWAIQTDLKSHQKQALTFMLQRELGWAYNRSEKTMDLWQLVATSTGRVFMNQISEKYQAEAPIAFSGGIIADAMGLGKTLTMIALVATDLDEEYKQPTHPDRHHEDGEDDQDGSIVKIPVSATLLIIPAPLFGSWEEQITQHVRRGQLQSRRHHGKTRLISIDELNGINLVITTYDTVSAEWKADRPSVLFGVRWRRIVLDEAHCIRNSNAIRTKAACALAAVSRWAVTGTPIQNRLGDLSALLAFVRAHPYTDLREFENDIARPWKDGEVEQATKRLKLLSSYLILRRPKTAITLPPRHDLLCSVELAPAERALYDKIREQALVTIDEAMHSDSEDSRAGVYVNTLQKIDSLRLICDLGLHYHKTRAGSASSFPPSVQGSKKTGKTSQVRPEQTEWARKAQTLFNLERNLGPIICQQCSAMLELTEAGPTDEGSAAIWSHCRKFTCSNCTKSLYWPPSSAKGVACGHQPACPMAYISTSGANDAEVSSDTLDLDIGGLPNYENNNIPLPSKVKVLLDDLCKQTPDTKSIVFSTWRLTLDVIERGLAQRDISCLRFDGKLAQKDRQNVVNRFNKDPSVRVLLLTLSCGAVGLTLTAATRAYLTEPHWNPTVEEQALARIYRLGQTKEVTTVRLVVKDSFEEQVVKLQESKKRLAEVLLSHHDTGQVDDDLDGLHRLRALL